MGERKVLNKYYPPDFDPSKLQRVRKGKDDSKQIKVRMMLPFSLRCGTCGNYIYKGTKFNSRKEDVEDETYLGLRIYRFYFRCPRCAGEISMKTDPKNSDYVCELGATRNFEPHREQQRQEESVKRKREEEEDGDAMRALENKTLESKREMDLLNALDDIKSANNRNAKVSTDQVIAALRRGAGKEAKVAREEGEEEAEVQQLRLLRSKNIKRLVDTEERGGAVGASGRAGPSRKKRAPVAVSFAVKARKESPRGGEEDGIEPRAGDSKPTGLAGLLAYGTSSSSSSS